jgi:hypothetical protein
MDFMNLVQFIVTWEQWKERDDFEHDTAYSPKVHFVPVVTVCQQALRRTVPAGADIFSIRLLRVNSSTGTEVSELYLVVHQQNVLGLDVSVKDAVSVHVVDRFQKLVHVVLHSVLRQVVSTAFDSIIHVHIHQFKN